MKMTVINFHFPTYIIELHGIFRTTCYSGAVAEICEHTVHKHNS